MNYPSDVFFDVETLLNNVKAGRILLLGDIDASFLNNYVEQQQLLKQKCKLIHLRSTDLESLEKHQSLFDVGIAINLFENISKTQGKRVLCKLRDVLTKQYCVCLPITQSTDNESWRLNDLFSFALERVASYHVLDKRIEYGLFKYNINTYKKTPHWLNPNNWANPNIWDKYRW